MEDGKRGGVGGGDGHRSARGEKGADRERGEGGPRFAGGGGGGGRGGREAGAFGGVLREKGGVEYGWAGAVCISEEGREVRFIMDYI